MSRHLRVKLQQPKSTRQNLKNDVQNNDKTISSAAMCQRRRRAQLKADPIAWAIHKAKEAERQRIRRKVRTEEQKKRDRETGNVRTKRYIERKKENGVSIEPKKKTPKVLTRTEKSKQQEYWRDKQRICRAKQTPQKKAWIKRKTKQRKAEKRSTEKIRKKEFVASTGFSTSGAKSKALTRLWSKLPSDPVKFAEIVSECITSKRITPRKREALAAKGLDVASLKCRKQLFTKDTAWRKLRNNIHNLKRQKGDIAKKKRQTIISALLVEKKYRINTGIARELGVRPNYMSQVQKKQKTGADVNERFRKTRSDSTCLDVVNNILKFYRSPSISRPLPTIKSVKKDLCSRQIMEVTVDKAYSLWKSQDETHNIVSFSTFQKLRPDDVLLQKNTRLSQCLCEPCTDIFLKLQALNQASVVYHKEVSVRDKYALVEATLCPKDSKHYKLKCVDRQCTDCGVQLLDEKFAELIEACNKEIGWKKWGSKEYTHDNKTKSKKFLSQKSGAIHELIDELKEEAKPFAKHLFNATWQQEMYSTISSNPPDGCVVMVLDFAENYACVNQDEIQSAHWSLDQVTIHPIVCFYKCPEENHDHVMQEAIVIISNDLKHDAHAVHRFTELALQHLSAKLNFDRVVEFTDGCSSQYKSKLPFADLSFSAEDFGVKQFERNYFGSSHGKGPSDGVSGVVKSAIRRAVMSRKAVVNTAYAMFTYCNNNLNKTDCANQIRNFIWVDKNEVNRERPTRVVKTLPGTRLLHSVKCVEPGVVDVRQLSCFCKGCEGAGECNNNTHVLPWQRRALSLTISPELKVIDKPIIDMIPIPEITEDDPSLQELMMSLQTTVPLDDDSLNTESEDILTDIILEGLNTTDTDMCDPALSLDNPDTAPAVMTNSTQANGNSTPHRLITGHGYTFLPRRQIIYG